MRQVQNYLDHTKLFLSWPLFVLDFEKDKQILLYSSASGIFEIVLAWNYYLMSNANSEIQIYFTPLCVPNSAGCFDD